MPVSTVPSALLFSLAAVLSLLPPPIASIIAAASGSPGSSRRTAPAGPDGGRPEPAAAALRVAVFAEAGFPSIDVQPIDRTDLARALAGLDVSWMDTRDLAASLARPRFDVVVLPYGSAFPKAAWPAIVAFLRAGGSWVNVGGTPVSVPVVRDGPGWRCEARATSYHRALSITHTFAVPVDRVTRHASRLPGVGAPDIGRLLRLDRSIGLNVRFADTRDYPNEDGTGGQRDARLDPLVTGTAADGAVVCAPVVGIDRLLGPFAGGRWVLANLVGGVGAELVGAMVAHAGEGASSFEIRPTMAGFLLGERPSFQVRLFRPWRGLDAAFTSECRVQIADGRGTAVGGFSIPLTGKGELLTGSGALPAKAAASLARGLYRVTASVPMGPVGQGRTTDSGAARVAGTGFLVYEPAMLAGGTPVSAGGAWLGRAGLPFPVAGTTYMASDVHRKFLFEPDAARWDDDFALMRQAGVNLVRTGVWTGWKNLMLDVGAPSEAMLRALDVFLLTARRHDIPVIFTVFAFLPESWGGANPYLDPRAVDAQRALVGALARRYAAAGDLIWDLINEPSFSSAAQLWTTRPNGDAFERAAWQQWLAARFGAATPEALDAALSEAWGTLPGEGALLPPLDEFRDRHLFGPLRPLRARDYKLFAQEMFTRWTEAMVETIREAGGAQKLVTVGQDEGGIAERPAPLFHGAAVDLTSVHTWWNNDALLWDVVMTRRPDRPHLVEETGLMMYDRMRGESWRTDDDARDLLERKLATAVAGGAAGFVQWIWNTNVYMPIDNESGIGFLRADGSVKPELASFSEWARVLRSHAGRLRGQAEEPVVVVVPQSQLLSPRDLASEATRRAVRTLAYDLRAPVRAVGEYQIAGHLGRPRLVVLPSARALSAAAWSALLAAAEDGSTLLVTGPIELDEYWRPTDRLTALGLPAAARPVAPEEPVVIDGRTVGAAFRGEKLERVEAAAVSGGAVVTVVPRGRGRIVWLPVPVELAEAPDATVAAYRYAARLAALEPSVRMEPDPPSMLTAVRTFDDLLLVVLANESSQDQTLRVIPTATGVPLDLSVPARRAMLAVVDRPSGRIVDRTRF